MSEKTRRLWAMWRGPLLMSALSATGLVAALLGDGAWDAASWIGLGVPFAACLWFGFRRSSLGFRR